MGARDGGNPRREFTPSEETRSNRSVESGFGNLVDAFSGLAVRGSSNDNLFQLIRTVEAAESTIQQQVEENNSLRAELQRRTQELERYKPDNSEHQSVSHIGNQADRFKWRDEASLPDSEHSSALQQNVMSKNDAPQTSAKHKYHSERLMNGKLNILPNGQATVDNAVSSRLSSSSSSSRSPSREGEYDPKFNLPGYGQMTMSEVDHQDALWKQDLIVKIRGHEEEILQLRKHLADYSIKEAQIRSEKYVLEKRVAYMRRAFDQQQQDLVEASSKAISYRQDIIEENIRLTYALQAAQQERSTFISTLLPLLEDYSLQPSVPDAQSIVNNLKVLFKHFQEKLFLSEEKLKDSHYQLLPWRSDALNEARYTPQSPYRSIDTAVTASEKLKDSHYQLSAWHSDALNEARSTPQSPYHTIGTAVTSEMLKDSHHQLSPWRSDAFNEPRSTPQSPYRSTGIAITTSHENRYELVPQSYSHGDVPISSSDAGTPTAWDQFGHHTHHTGPVGVVEKNLEQDNLRRSSPSTSRNDQNIPAKSVARSHAKHFAEQLSFTGLVRSHEVDDSDAVDDQNGREVSAHWGSSSSPYSNPTPDDPSSSFSPNLPPVLEETSSSFSEEDDPLPGIEGLQVSGEAFPGRELLACGYSTNGTTSCNFEWVRYLEDGSVNYIDGAKQPSYLVTADDVDSYLAIEVQPIDNRKRKGELVKVFANDQRKITCDPEMQEQIQRALHDGHASYEVSLAVGYLDIWEPAILAIKRAGYSIKCDGRRGVVVTEKFSPSTAVLIPYGQDAAFSILSPGGMEYLLRTTNNNSLRDIIVLTMRLFIIRAVEKRKVKKKGLFFNK